MIYTDTDAGLSFPSRFRTSRPTTPTMRFPRCSQSWPASNHGRSGRSPQTMNHASPGPTGAATTTLTGRSGDGGAIWNRSPTPHHRCSVGPLPNRDRWPTNSPQRLAVATPGAGWNGGFTWGDVATLYYWIRDTDLRRKHFNDVTPYSNSHRRRRMPLDSRSTSSWPAAIVPQGPTSASRSPCADSGDALSAVTAATTATIRFVPASRGTARQRRRNSPTTPPTDRAEPPAFWPRRKARPCPQGAESATRTARVESVSSVFATAADFVALPRAPPQAWR